MLKNKFTQQDKSLLKVFKEKFSVVSISVQLWSAAELLRYETGQLTEEKMWWVTEQRAAEEDY